MIFLRKNKKKQISKKESPSNKIICENNIWSVIFNSSTISDDNKFWIIKGTEDLSTEELFRLRDGKESPSPDFQIFEWLKLDNEYVEKGQQILFIQKGNPEIEKYVFKKVWLGLPIISPESGIFVSHCYVGESVQDGDKLFSVLPLEKNELSNYCENIVFNYHFDRYDIPSELRDKIKHVGHPGDKPIYLNSWIVNNGQYVEKGTPLMEIKCGSTVETYFEYNLEAKSNGFVDFFKYVPNEYPEIYGLIRQNDHLYSLYKNKSRKYYNKPIIITDDFSNEKTIKWEVVGGLERPFNSLNYNPIGGIQTISDNGMDLFFSFQNHAGRDYIVFNYFSNEYKLNRSDKILFLFDTGEKVSFEVQERVSKSRSVWKHLNEVKVPISLNELRLFSNSKLKKWRIELNKTNLVLEGSNGNSWYQNDDFIELIQSYTKEFCLLVEKEVDNYKPFEDEEEKQSVNNINEKCFVYLMIDNTNQYHKIGISNSPEYREKTLQSEKPTIELICAKEFPSRKIAESIEKALHETFSDKRLRGEWFELSEPDINEIKQTLK
jgi:hypothetical protein